MQLWRCSSYQVGGGTQAEDRKIVVYGKVMVTSYQDKITAISTLPS